MLTSIAGHVVVVTAASKGTGKGIAQVFARQGARVMVVSRNLDEAHACAQALAANAHACAADVSDWGAIQALAASIPLRRLGSIDCAGVLLQHLRR